MREKGIILAGGILVLTVVADLYTKWLVMENFRYMESREVIPGFFNLTFLLNKGAAFGMLANAETGFRQGFFALVGLAALISLTLALRHYRDRVVFASAIGLIAGGALGNFVDRARFGAVVDFLDFYVASYHWPAFNVADSAITVGVGIFLVAGLLDSREESLSMGGVTTQESEDRIQSSE